MAGRGSRFETAGYSLPKPLIPIHGVPMAVRAIRSLGLKDAKFYILINSTLENTDLVQQITNEVDATVQSIDYVTDGATCSAMLFDKFVNTDEELVIANCDQIMEWNSEIFLLNARQYDGCIVTYYATTEHNSYATINQHGIVTKVKEKEVISNISLNGIHYWKKGSYFVESARAMMAANDRAPNGEFYIAPTYNYMINSSLNVGIYHIPNEQHHNVGLPADLESFIQYERTKYGIT